jgi:phosphoribosylformylglycinamidine cyclo-ligase
VFDIAKLDAENRVPAEFVGAVSDRESASATADLRSETPPTKEVTVGELLLRPTTIYTRAVRGVLSYYKVKSVVHGIAHITGGGIFENLDRILPPGVGVTIDRGSWPVLPVFNWLQQLGDVDDDEMYRVFNMGVGLMLVVSPYYAESIQQQLAKSGLESWVIGRAVEGDRDVRWS